MHYEFLNIATLQCEEVRVVWHVDAVLSEIGQMHTVD